MATDFATHPSDEATLARAQLDAILRSSADAITMMTIDGIVLSWNLGAEAMFGYSEAEIVGRQINDFTFDSSQQRDVTPFDHARHGDGPRHYETIRQHRDGTRIHVQMTVCTILGEAENLVALSVTYRSLIAEKRAINSLNSANSVLRHLIETSPFGVYAIDADFRLAMVGVGARKVFENIDPLIDRDMVEILTLLWPEEFAQEVISRFRHTLETGEAYRSESTVEQRADIDEVEAYDWKIERISMPDGRFGLVCHFYDFTDRLKLEAEAQEREMRLTLAIDGAKLGTWSQEKDSDEIVWNEHAQRILGYTGDLGNVLFHKWRDRVHPDDKERIGALFQQCLADGVTYHTEHRIITPQGQTKWIEIYGKHSEDGDLAQFAGVFADITDRKMAEEQIKYLMGEANHRSKNLLAVVQAVAQQTAKTDGEKSFVDRLGSRIRGLAASQDILLAGQQEGIELNALIRAQLAGFSDVFDRRISLSGPKLQLLPAAAQSLGMAIHELATNASKYGALSNRTGTVEICWSLNDTDEGIFKISWTENGGPDVVAPETTGFGQNVIVNMIKAALRGTVELDYAVSGLRWSLHSPISRTLDNK